MKKLNYYFKKRYRIVTDCYSGYEVQYLLWYFPFWQQCGFTNTHISIKDAKDYMNEKIQEDKKMKECRNFKRKVVFP